MAQRLVTGEGAVRFGSEARNLLAVRPNPFELAAFLRGTQVRAVPGGGRRRPLEFTRSEVAEILHPGFQDSPSKKSNNCGWVLGQPR